MAGGLPFSPACFVSIVNAKRLLQEVARTWGPASQALLGFGALLTPTNCCRK